MTVKDLIQDLQLIHPETNIFVEVDGLDEDTLFQIDNIRINYDLPEVPTAIIVVTGA